MPCFNNSVNFNGNRSTLKHPSSRHRSIRDRRQDGHRLRDHLWPRDPRESHRHRRRVRRTLRYNASHRPLRHHDRHTTSRSQIRSQILYRQTQLQRKPSHKRLGRSCLLCLYCKPRSRINERPNYSQVSHRQATSHGKNEHHGRCSLGPRRIGNPWS